MTHEMISSVPLFKHIRGTNNAREPGVLASKRPVDECFCVHSHYLASVSTAIVG